MRDFSEAPFLVIWEVTQACDLACRHCRASAQPERHPAELTRAEAEELIRQIREFGDPLLVFTGGDPLKREDLFDLLRMSVAAGLRTTITPSATPLLTGEAVRRFRDAGVARMAVSLDGADAPQHDGFRGVEGSFRITLEALRAAREAGLETQINTTVTRRNFRSLDRIAALVEDSGARLWSVFFLVVTGRAQLEDDLTAEEYEQVFEFLYRISLTAPFDVKTTEAQHYRRFAARQRKASGAAPARASAGAIARQAGINDGKGLLFISHTGEIYPSGFLEISAGNVRNVRLADAYRNSRLFRVLRNADALGGKCGVCEYRNLCGGSRARAWALTGDFLAADPRCSYLPPAFAEPASPMQSRSAPPA
ncbi:MAG: TIGR04053 family radical SAM/SPASM domain-containing protein [Bryobacteraceae bacterium]